jgi:hypothetical protein
MVVFTDSYTDILSILILLFQRFSGKGEFLIYPYTSGTSIRGS